MYLFERLAGIKHKSKILFILIIIVITGIVIAYYGYISPALTIEKGEEGYNRITVEKEFAHYTFEYPESLDLSFLNYWDEADDVSLLFMREAPGGLHEEMSLYVRVSNESGTTVTKEINRIEAVRDGVKLARLAITVDGITGEQIQLNYSDEFTDEDDPVPTFLWAVVFENEGLLYLVQIQSDVELTEKTIEQFIHLLESFELLE